MSVPQIDASTLASGAFNVDEVKVVSGLGELSDPHRLTVFVSTARGFGQVDFADLDTAQSTTWLVVGRAQPTIADDATRTLDDWCDS